MAFVWGQVLAWLSLFFSSKGNLKRTSCFFPSKHIYLYNISIYNIYISNWNRYDMMWIKGNQVLSLWTQKEQQETWFHFLWLFLQPSKFLDQTHSLGLFWGDWYSTVYTNCLGCRGRWQIKIPNEHTRIFHVDRSSSFAMFHASWCTTWFWGQQKDCILRPKEPIRGPRCHATCGRRARSGVRSIVGERAR